MRPQQQRDERGRFVRGNTAAHGNKGNTRSKWGNRNAMKHGLYGAPPFLVMRGSFSPNLLHVYVSRATRITFDSNKGEWIMRDDGSIQIFGHDKIEFLQAAGMPLIDPSY